MFSLLIPSIHSIIGIFTPTSLTPAAPRKITYLCSWKERKKERDKESKIILVLATPWKLLFSKHL